MIALYVLSAVLRVLVGAVGDSSSAVQDAAAVSLRENAQQCVLPCRSIYVCSFFYLSVCILCGEYVPVIFKEQGFLLMYLDCRCTCA